MSSKSVIGLGLLASILLIFLCIFFNAERYYEELGLSSKSNKVSPVTVSSITPQLSNMDKSEQEPLATIVLEEESNDTVQETKEEDRVADISTEEIKEETSSFNYYTENERIFISGKLPLLENGDVFKQFILNCSKDELCENNITFLDNEETLSWKGLVSSLIALFNKEEILNPKLYIDKNIIRVEGLFSEQTGKDQLLTLIEEQKDGYTLSDMTTVVVKEEAKEEVLELLSTEELPKKEHLKKELVDEESKAETTKGNLEIEQKKVTTLLTNNKINFKKNSGKIRTEGKKVLDEVALILLGKENIHIEVQGHTDAGGKKRVNLQISQMRANGVKKYLIKKGLIVDSITAKGYGEEKLLLPETPYSPSNRRVEIYLKRKVR